MKSRDDEPPLNGAPSEAPNAPRRIGFMVGLGDSAVPDDFDRMGEAEIVALFAGEP